LGEADILILSSSSGNPILDICETVSPFGEEKYCMLNKSTFPSYVPPSFPVQKAKDVKQDRRVPPQSEHCSFFRLFYDVQYLQLRDMSFGISWGEFLREPFKSLNFMLSVSVMISHLKRTESHLISLQYWYLEELGVAISPP